MDSHCRNPAGQPDPGNASRLEPRKGFEHGERTGLVIAVAGFTLCFVLFLWPLVSGREEPRWDAYRQFYPSFTYIADAYAQGRFPLWDPYSNCGYPFHADPQNPVLNPVAIALGLLVPDSGRAFVLYYLVLWWIAGIGAIWAVKALGGGPAGGFVTAMAYAFSGYFIGHAQHTPYICAAAGLPWVIGLATKSVADSRSEYALLGGATLGLSALGGYPILVSFTGLSLALWLPLWFLPDAQAADAGRTRSGLLKEILFTLCIVGAVAVLIWSPVLHAFFIEGRGYTDRVEPLSPALANYGDSLTFTALLSSMFPYATILWGWRMGADHSMTNVYLGAASIPLAVYWILRDNMRKRWGLLLFIALMFLTSLGGRGGVRVLLYYLFAPLRFFRFSAPFRLYWILPLALAAGLGFSRLIRHLEEKRTAIRACAGWLAIVTGAILLIVLLAILRFGIHGLSAEHTPVRLFLPALLALPAFLVALWIGTRGANPRVFRISVVLLLLIIAGDMWGHVVNNQERIWGTEKDSIRKAEATHRRDSIIEGEPGPRRRPPSETYYMNAQQVDKVPAVAGYVTMKTKGFDEVLSRSNFVEVLSSTSRFWLSSGTEPASSEQEVLEVLSDVGTDVRVPVFVSERRYLLSGERTVPGDFGKVRVVYYSPERVDLEVEVPGRRNAVLASTERYAAGWRAHVDGDPATVFRVNLYFRGILVPPGKHRVEWKYEPTLWRPLVNLGLATLIGSVVGAIYLSRRRSVSAQPKRGDPGGDTR